MHIGAPDGVTLLEFEGPTPEEVAAALTQESPAGEEVVPEDLPDCPEHRAASFVKGKPRSIYNSY